jgi:hypothetical protein
MSVDRPATVRNSATNVHQRDGAASAAGGPHRLPPPEFGPATIARPELVYPRSQAGAGSTSGRNQCPRTATLRPFTADELCHIAVEARIEALEKVTGDDLGGLVAMLRRLDQDIVEAWRPM